MNDKDNKLKPVFAKQDMNYFIVLGLGVMGYLILALSIKEMELILYILTFFIWEFICLLSDYYYDFRVKNQTDKIKNNVAKIIFLSKAILLIIITMFVFCLYLLKLIK